MDPVVFDLADEGFHLTSAAQGVTFDFFGAGKRAHIPWTAFGSHNGWLALDLNHDTRVDNGTEMFGNAMAQSGRRIGWTGFGALAQFDLPARGGDGDGVIDSRDNIFSHLLLWIDLNHNGISEPGELLSMSQAGIASIDLHYQESKYTDVFGNQFRYRSRFRTVWNGQGKDHWAYDVVLAGRGLTH